MTMKRILLTVGIAAGLNCPIAFAQHENMPGHEKMPPGDHAKHEKEKKGGDADKKEPPKSTDQKKDGGADTKQPPKSTDQNKDGGAGTKQPPKQQ
jgi:Ni/Co efflux regulator RcnB